MDPKLIGLAIVAYLVLKSQGIDLLGGLLGGSTGTPVTPTNPTAPTGPTAAELASCAAAGGVWDSVSNMCIPANVITGHSDPTTLAARLVTVASAAGYGSNPVLTFDQWSWFAMNKLTPPLTPPDFGSDAPRDANQQTPQCTALQYAQIFVRHSAGGSEASTGVSGLSGLSGLSASGSGVTVLDMSRRGAKWTM